MHDEIKQAVGIETANCKTCYWLGSDGDGHEYNGSWPICDKIDRMGYLKSFPFQKEMPCWEPEFWASKFPERIRLGEHEEIMALVRRFWLARDGFAECRQMWA